jgi:hypothetical protein
MFMGYTYSERHREEYINDGLTILRGIIPASLLGDLRREADRGREVAHRLHGPQAQRIQPVFQYEELDPIPFRNFLDLPELRTTVENILGTDNQPSDRMGILLEPAETAWCTAWHRDWWAEPGVDPERYAQVRANLQMFNQFNAALYDEHALWVVPGSHNRPDTDVERAQFSHSQIGHPQWPAELSPVKREMACLQYARSMPGAQQIVLCAGDMAFYRSISWHIGNYVPYCKRATLHDGFYSDADRAWWDEMSPIRARRSMPVAASATT